MSRLLEAKLRTVDFILWKLGWGVDIFEEGMIDWKERHWDKPPGRGIRAPRNLARLSPCARRDRDGDVGMDCGSGRGFRQRMVWDVHG